MFGALAPNIEKRGRFATGSGPGTEKEDSAASLKRQTIVHGEEPRPPMIVVDTNTIAYFYIQGPRTGQAEKVWTKDSEWIAPSIWRSEFISVLALCFRQGTVSFDDALLIAEEAQLLMQEREESSVSQRAAEILTFAGMTQESRSNTQLNRNKEKVVLIH